MRRWKVWTLATFMLFVTASLMTLAAPLRLAHLTAVTTSTLIRATGRGLATAVQDRAHVNQCLAHAFEYLAAPAQADEVLQFKPVSPESAARLEARVRRAREARRSLPAPPASPDTLTPLAPEDQVPGTPAEPVPPLPPLPPRHAGEMMRIGSDIHVEKDQTVDGDVVAISGDVRVDGHVKGSVQSLGGDVYLGSTARVDGDVAAVKGELHEEPGAYVGGQRVTALSGRRARIGRHHLAEAVDRIHRPLHELWRFSRALAWLLVMLGLVWLILRIAPQRTGVAVEVLRRETAASLGIGLLMWVLLVPSVVALALVVAILCITIIGIPVALAALLAYFLLIVVLMFWGFMVGAAWLGGQVRVGFSNGSALHHALIGTVVILGMRAVGHLIAIIPFFGFFGGFLVAVSWILSGTATTLGAGALLRTESASGQLGRWWRGWRGGTPRAGSGPIPAGAPTGVAPVGAAPLATPPIAPPAPPAAFAPPSPPEPPPVPPGDPGASYAPPTG